MKKRTRRDFGFNTMIRRKSVHMTQIFLASKVGMSTSRLSLLENDEATPTPEERDRIHEVLTEVNA